MEIDSIDSVDTSDFFDSTTPTPSSLWFGREVSIATEKSHKLEYIAQFFFSQLKEGESILNYVDKELRYHLLDLEEEVIEEISTHLDEYADYAYTETT